MADITQHPGTGQQYMSLPPPYPPCTTPLSDLEATAIRRLHIHEQNRGEVLYATVTSSAKPYQKVTGCDLVDEDGTVARLTLWCSDADFDARFLHENSKLAIKEPFFYDVFGHPPLVKVHHPSSLIALARCETDEEATLLKERGNALFEARRLGAAATAYEQGLKAVSASETSIRNDLSRNLAQVYLTLRFYDLAKAHANKALHKKQSLQEAEDGASPSDEVSRETVGDVKALYRAACASSSLRELESANQSLRQLLELSPEHAEAHKELLRVYRRLNEEQHGAYDFFEMLDKAVTLSPYIDAASFTIRTVVLRSAGKGNGLFAAADLNIGDLVLCEKAFAADFTMDQTKEPMRTYDSSRGIYGAIPASLWHKTVQTLVKNPSRGSQLLKLGGNYSGLRTEGLKIEDTHVVDVFQVHDIVARNSFGIPYPQSSAKTDQWGLYTSQSGRDGGTSQIPRNAAIFCQAAFINHSCLPNVEKRFIGDIILLRATRPIRKGEEILLDCTPGEFHDVRTRKPGFERTWQFSCDCSLCAAESQLSDQALHRRIALIADANDLSEKLSRALPVSVQWGRDVVRLEELAVALKSCYTSTSCPKH